MQRSKHLTLVLCAFSLQSQIDTQMTKTSFCPAAKVEVTGRSFLDVRAQSLSVPRCAMNQREESTQLTQQGTLGAEEPRQRRLTDRGGKTSHLPTASYHCT